jgi:hypothetical protein
MLSFSFLSFFGWPVHKPASVPIVLPIIMVEKPKNKANKNGKEKGGNGQEGREKQKKEIRNK